MLVNLIVCCFETYMYFDFMGRFLEKKYNSRIINFIIAIGMILMDFEASCHQGTVINLFGTILTMVIVSTIAYTDRRKVVVFYNIIFYVIAFSTEFLGGIVITLLQGTKLINTINPYNSYIVLIFTKLANYVLLKWISMFLDKSANQVRGKYLKMAMFLPAASLMIFFGLYCSGVAMQESFNLLSAGCTLLVVANVLVFYILEKLISAMNKNKEYELIKMQNDSQSVYYDKMDEVSQNQRVFAHNLNAYLETISGLATRGDNKDILDVLRSMEVEIRAASDHVYTGNSMLNALLCEKEASAIKQGIKINIMVEPCLNVDFIESGDLIIMVGNLLNNAIEAAQQCKKEKMIDLQFYRSEGSFVVFDLQNSFEHTLNRMGSYFVTTKEDKEHHGLGMKSVRKTAEKYGGMLYTEQMDNCFSTILTLSDALQDVTCYYESEKYL